MNDHHFAAVRELAAESGTAKAALGALARLAAAAEDSAFARFGSRGLTAFRSWPASDQVRYAALTLAVAGTTNLLLLSQAGGYPSPGIPRSVIAVGVVLAGIAAAAPRYFHAAWPDSLVARVWSQGKHAQNSAE